MARSANDVIRRGPLAGPARFARFARFATMAVAVAMMAACSDSTVSSAATTVAPIPVGHPPLLVDQIGVAVSALEAELGGPQQYFEVNATPTLVNVFVATSNATQAVAYVFAAGKLAAPSPALAASGPTFAKRDIDFDPTRVLAGVVRQLPDSSPLLFSVVGRPVGGVDNSVTVGSSQGAEFKVYLRADGAILGTDQLLGAGQS